MKLTRCKLNISLSVAVMLIVGIAYIGPKSGCKTGNLAYQSYLYNKVVR